MAKMTAILARDGDFELREYKENDDPITPYWSLWHLHPERKKKQGLVSNGRKCMDCGAVSPDMIGVYPVEEDGYVSTPAEKVNYKWIKYFDSIRNEIKTILNIK